MVLIHEYPGPFTAVIDGREVECARLRVFLRNDGTKHVSLQEVEE